MPPQPKRTETLAVSATPDQPVPEDLPPFVGRQIMKLRADREALMTERAANYAEIDRCNLRNIAIDSRLTDIEEQARKLLWNLR